MTNSFLSQSLADSIFSSIGRNTKKFISIFGKSTSIDDRTLGINICIGSAIALSPFALIKISKLANDYGLISNGKGKGSHRTWFTTEETERITNGKTKANLPITLVSHNIAPPTAEGVMKELNIHRDQWKKYIKY